MDLGEKQGLKGWTLYPSNDHIVFNISKNIERVKGFYKTLIPAEKSLLNIYNKQNLLDLAEKLDIPYPKTYYPQSEELDNFDLKLPVITKGKYGLTFYKTMGRKAFVAITASELKQQLHEIGKKLAVNESFVQEIIPSHPESKTISFGGFCVDGEVKSYWIGVKLREHPLQFGTATFTESIYNEKVYDFAVKLIKELNYSGICEVEFLYHSGEQKYMLIEINPRTWLWVGHAKACGVNLALYMYNYLNGIKNQFPKEYKVGIRWRNFWTDNVFSMQAILQLKLNPIKYLQSLNGIVVDAVKSKDDPKPFKAMTRMLFAIARRR
jgi:predicted ATP-grasp superfamily ATP-dependent carboligase